MNLPDPKSCPFCGHPEPEVLYDFNSYNEINYIRVSCRRCPARFQGRHALLDWNTRTKPQPSPEIKALLYALDLADSAEAREHFGAQAIMGHVFECAYKARGALL